ncbi:LPS export ABC transporter permease LptF [Inhella gelatinilytica]|uniref:Lipopolysaccharide export system permease protein LptF n=1 Tax=Inhella gelatinilytica TaxID=2795030 RepID=A0A931NBM7_9BURK|nr:LPS export ABC transporter permease LptF [Inhella gelatinilytica]MBH9553743.1 LPS export ABC transporter permease LptF [Inhella gelatinilytica]
MLFHTSFRSELARQFGVSLVVLITIVLTFALIKTLGAAAGGKVDPADVLLALFFAGVTQLPVVLALALFIAVVGSVSRLYRDSEMAVWLASGQPLRRFLGPIASMAWPVWLGLAILMLWVTPWTQRETVQMRERYEKRSDLSRVAPGQFQSSRDGSKVFFIERGGESQGIGRNVFILTQKAEQEAVITAAEGRVEWEGEDRFLSLTNGQRAETLTAAEGRTVARFAGYRVLTDAGAARSMDELPPKAMSTQHLALSEHPRHHGQLVWRVGLIWGAINLSILGVGLAASNPRRPNNWGLVAALLVFIIYYHLINLTEGWVGRERLTPAQALLSVHGSVAVLAISLILLRDEGLRFHWRRFVGATS